MFLLVCVFSFIRIETSNIAFSLDHLTAKTSVTVWKKKASWLTREKSSEKSREDIVCMAWLISRRWIRLQCNSTQWTSAKCVGTRQGFLLWHHCESVSHTSHNNHSSCSRRKKKKKAPETDHLLLTNDKTVTADSKCMVKVMLLNAYKWRSKGNELLVPG